MHWIRVHPYIFLLATAAVLLVVGALVFKEQSTTLPNSSSTIAWGGLGGGFFYPISGVNKPAENAEEETDLYNKVQSGPPFSYTLYAPPKTEGDAQNDFDLDAFLALLASENQNAETGIQTSDSLLVNPYTFIPSGSTLPTSPAKERTPTQQALYKYGNEAGFYVQSFENANKNMADVVQKQIDDPQGPLAVAALVELAKNLAKVGNSLEKIADVPAQATSVNTKLAGSYKDVGAKLALVPDAKTDEERAETMLTYNAAAEEFVKSYVALVTLFSISEVTFTPDEPGSVFTFTATSL